mgnify:CR=1 FL=1
MSLGNTFKSMRVWAPNNVMWSWTTLHKNKKILIIDENYEKNKLLSWICQLCFNNFSSDAQLFTFVIYQTWNSLDKYGNVISFYRYVVLLLKIFYKSLQWTSLNSDLRRTSESGHTSGTMRHRTIQSTKLYSIFY